MYTREASTLDLFCDSVRCMGDATLCGVMEFDRQLDTRLLKGAAQACLLAHPILHSRLIRGDGPAFWVMVDDAHVPPLEAEKCSRDYRPLVIGPVDPYGPQQFRVRLLRRPSGDAVVINLSHAAADAYGLNTLMAQLLQEYEAPGSICPARGGIPERDTLWTRGLARDRVLEQGEMRVNNALWPDPFGTSGAPVSFHRECISQGDLAAVRAYAGRRGGSINDAVVAAYYLAISDLSGHRDPIDIFFPVNLRRHLGGDSRVMTNQSTNVCVSLGRKEGDGMDEILTRVIAVTQAHKADGIGIAEQAGMDAACDPEGKNIDRMAGQMAALQHQGRADIFFSNVGPVTLPDMPGLADAYICYPGGLMPATCIVTSTFRERMTITMGFQDSERPRVGTGKAIRLFRDNLLSLAGIGSHQGCD